MSETTIQVQIDGGNDALRLPLHDERVDVDTLASRLDDVLDVFLPDAGSFDDIDYASEASQISEELEDRGEHERARTDEVERVRAQYLDN